MNQIYNLDTLRTTSIFNWWIQLLWLRNKDCTFIFILLDLLQLVGIHVA